MTRMVEIQLTNEQYGSMKKASAAKHMTHRNGSRSASPVSSDDEQSSDTLKLAPEPHS